MRKIIGVVAVLAVSAGSARAQIAVPAPIQDATLMERVLKRASSEIPGVGRSGAYNPVRQKLRSMDTFALRAALNEVRGPSASWLIKVAEERESLARQLEREVMGVIGKAMRSVVLIQIGQGTGTGFFVDPKGYVLTNHHVIAPAGKWGSVSIQASDETRFSGKVIALDETRDLALIRVEAGGRTWPVLEFADLSEIVHGRFVVALGHPYGMPFSSSFGIVTGVNRPGSMVGKGVRYVQTDTVINPGNSGGPLVGLDGKVIGVNNFIMSPGRMVPGYDGMGFAICSEDAAAFVALTLPDEEPVEEEEESVEGEKKDESAGRSPAAIQTFNPARMLLD